VTDATLFDPPEQPPTQTHACSGDGCRVCALLTALPRLPYAGTSGWSGSDTSESRARDADMTGTTARRQVTVLELLDSAGFTGMTWAEVASVTGWHHGTASGTLSVLHAAGDIKRLTEKRARCKVYVLPEHASGRAVEQPRSRKTTCPHCGGHL